MKSSNQSFNYLIVFALLSCALLVVRFSQISLVKQVNNHDLIEYAQVHENRRSSITQARRGTIFDTNNLPIAMDATSYSMYAILQGDGDNVVRDPDDTAARLAKYVPLTRDQILKRLLTFGAYQVEFRELGLLTPEEKRVIESENLPGIVLVSQTNRMYVNDVFASHLIGYASIDDEQDISRATLLTGKMGLEQEFNPELSGKVTQGSIQSGNDIYLTIDSRLQNPLEKLMDDYVKLYQPKALNAYLVEVQSGKILAASQRPTFNLNTRDGIDREWKNLMVGEAYEPGSTIKTITTAVAYDYGLFTPYELYQSGSIDVYDQVVKDHNGYGWGTITFEEGFARSSNVAMVNLVNRMGDEKWTSRLLEFGFGQSTDFGLENEVSGSVVFDSPVTRIMSGFGQGFSATPIQLLQAFSVFANDGEMRKMQVVDQIGGKQIFQPVSLGQPISSEAAHYILKLMIDTVEKPYGTAQAFKHPGLRVAAKTGTAQIANSNGVGYLTGDNDYYHSAVIFFPAEQPKYMMYVSMKQPAQTYGKIGSQILGELFNRFVDTVMVYD